MDRNCSRAHWMYHNRIINNRVQKKFLKGVQYLIKIALEHPNCVKNGCIKCPCNLEACRNKQYLTPTEVFNHLKRNGFMSEYYVWTCHGEEGLSEAYLEWRERRGLGPLPELLYCCRNGCMDYEDEDADLMACKYCGLRRYDYYT